MSPKIINTLVVLIVSILSLAILANSMTKPLGHDEQMYCSAGVLLARGEMIYRDFSYVAQMPYQPLFYAGLFKLFNTTHYLLAGRMLSGFCDILVAVCIVGIYRRIFEAFPITGLLLGLAGAILFVFNPLVDYAAGFAWNHELVILFVVLSLWLFISTDFKQKSKYRASAIIGVLLTLATCMRITTVLVQVLFFVMLVTQSGSSAKQGFKTALPFLIASAVVLIWPAWTIAVAPQAFFLNLLRIPMLNSEWLHQMGMVYNKFYLTSVSLTTGGYFVLIVLTIYLYLTVAWNRRRLIISNRGGLLLAALLPLTFFIIAFIPPTMWRQYLAMPVPFLVISLAYPLLYLRELAEKTSGSNRFNIACIAIIGCIVVAVASNPVVLGRIPKFFTPQKWVPIRLHKISEDISEKLKTKNSKLILTLAPLYALEGGCDIYPEFSAGVFVYRIADYLTASERLLAHAAGPKTLGALIEKAPPSAVILGVEPKYFSFLEEALFESVIKPDREKWERKIYDNELVVYFSP